VKTKRPSLILIALGLLACVTASAQTAAPPKSASTPYFWYRGELLDTKNRPISGVFSLTFKLFDQSGGGPVLWQERRFVAVEDGSYDVKLGLASPLHRKVVEAEVVLATELEGQGQMSIEPIRVRLVTPESDPRSFRLPASTFVAERANKAQLALHAQQADNCITLNGKPLAEFDRFDDMLRELTILRQEASAEQQGTRIGVRAVGLPRVGGGTGNRYSRSCPPGTVMTGATIHAGDLVDSITATCTRIE
jgi:hypothetical protein